MKKPIITQIFILLIFTGPYSYSRSDSVTIYLAKDNWHTGIIIPVNNFVTENLPVIKQFESYKYVDIGWGDEDFYQSPDFDLYLAAKAILIPSSSVIRIGGYSFPIEQIIEWRDYAIEFVLSKDHFLQMLMFIKNSFTFNENGEYITLNNEKYSSVLFFKSIHKYHALMTCNTWAAEALNSAKITVDSFGLVTAEQLYSKLKSKGEVRKKIK
jgi:uncharacterized protein (TIGR02117 family)